jgi:hypothetical protein
MKRLTLKQTQVLAALERTGRTTLLELSKQFPGQLPSEVWRVVQALVRRGLAATEGDPRWIYAGTPETFIQAGHVPPDGTEPFYVSTTSHKDYSEAAV